MKQFFFHMRVGSGDVYSGWHPSKGRELEGATRVMGKVIAPISKSPSAPIE